MGTHGMRLGELTLAKVLAARDEGGRSKSLSDSSRSLELSESIEGTLADDRRPVLYKGGSRKRDTEQADQLALANFVRQVQNDEYTRAKDERDYQLSVQKESSQLALQYGKEAFDREKSFVSEFSENYFKAKGNPALQSHMVEVGRRRLRSLDPLMQDALEPFLVDGPLSLAEQNRQAFRKRNPQPQFTKDLDPQKDPMTYASELMAIDEYNNAEQEAATGVKVPDKKFYTLGEGLYAVKGTDGAPMLLTENDLAVKKMNEVYGQPTAAQIISQNGKVVSQNEIEVQLDGRKQVVKSYYNVLTGESGYDPVPEPASDRKMLKDWERKFATDFTTSFAAMQIDPSIKGSDPGSVLARGAVQLAESGASTKEIQDFVQNGFASANVYVAVKPTGVETDWGKTVMRNLVRVATGPYSAVVGAEIEAAADFFGASLGMTGDPEKERTYGAELSGWSSPIVKRVKENLVVVPGVVRQIPDPENANSFVGGPEAYWVVDDDTGMVYDLAGVKIAHISFLKLALEMAEGKK